MEENVQVLAKKLWHVVRVAFFVLRKNMSKRKLLLDLKYLAMKRPKLARNSLARKLTHHHSRHHNCGGGYGGAYEFSCSNTPNHQTYFPFELNHNKRPHKQKNHPHLPINGKVGESEVHAVNKVVEMMLTSGEVEMGSPLPYFYSPGLSGFEFGPGSRSPIVRVTDSPYPLHEEVGNYKVDEAAEEFIQRFYNQLRQQRITDA